MATALLRLAWLASLACPLILHAAPDAVTPDGGRYHGPLQAGKLHGTGRMEWDNGARYEGEFADGLFHGSGTLHMVSGDVYEGEFRRGAMAGRGLFKFSNGDVYAGAFERDAFNGPGHYKTARGEIYEGEFKDDTFEGEGVHIGAGAEYRGQFVDWRYHGTGELRFKDGTTYRGGFAAGEYHGHGRLEREGGEAYEGTFVEGAFTEGAYMHPAGVRHEGTFSEWRPNGRGRFTDPQGNVFEGTFADGALDGEGRFEGKDGTRYEGGFKRWLYHGQGRLQLPNGDVYVGGFEYGEYDGEGTLNYAKAQADGRTQVSGTWRDGVLDLGKEARQKPLADLERALYLQRSLLDAALAGVQPSDPTRIHMYFLGVAGDGTQEVFRREVEYVRDQFAHSFGTAGRSVALINSRSTLAQQPMATTTSVREAVMAIAARMDKDRDILFVFLSSHGSKEHELSLDQSDMNLRDLGAADLGAMLKEAGIRWKVVVVSACYSGGFIDPMKDDHALIITAARTDRRSFGCDDANEFTYFGEAFFQEALPRSASFEAAFREAEQLVNAREQADLDGKEPPADHFSLPQMHVAEPVAKHLEAWRTGLSASK